MLWMNLLSEREKASGFSIMKTSTSCDHGGSNTRCKVYYWLCTPRSLRLDATAITLKSPLIHWGLRKFTGYVDARGQSVHVPELDPCSIAQPWVLARE